MLIKGTRPTRGKFFAIWPRRTRQGWAALEWLNWELVPGWGWGSDDTYRYWRGTGNDEAEAAAEYTTPADLKRCANYQADGPTPCWHPRCDCMNDVDVPGYSIDPADGSHYRREPRSDRDMGTRMMGCGDSDR